MVVTVQDLEKNNQIVELLDKLDKMGRLRAATIEYKLHKNTPAKLKLRKNNAIIDTHWRGTKTVTYGTKYRNLLKQKNIEIRRLEMVVSRGSVTVKTSSIGETLTILDNIIKIPLTTIGFVEKGDNLYVDIQKDKIRLLSERNVLSISELGYNRKEKVYPF